MNAMDLVTRKFIDLAENGKMPDAVLRLGIKKLCHDRLKSLQGPDLDSEKKRLQSYVEVLRKAPIAVHTEAANTQHYEVPTEFYRLALGKNLKYSSAYFAPGVSDLSVAEDEALLQTIKRAELKDGMRILELGCGWGSLTLAMARKFPNAKITGISNSRTQRESILAAAKAEGLSGVEIITRNLSTGIGLPVSEFDRVVSVEMFEHMQNYRSLMAQVSEVLKPEGKLFIHIFTHRQFAYPFQTEGEDDWMGKYFFTGGQMPSHDLLLFFQDDLKIQNQWAWSGCHYAKTAEAWLANQDRNREKIIALFQKTYGSIREAEIWFNRWRMFFLACAELFNYDQGNEWGVSHYLFQNSKAGTPGESC
ncbi:MAG: class I SAM-dependent methyltransferase [Cryobacterium sp.]|nr:class I SAM-dependent methyltransferase [Oligoflexia bacterium]